MEDAGFWVNRSSNDGPSADGSTRRLNLFKSEFLNSIIQKYEIESVLDFGCGQSSILESLKVDEYLGFDPNSKVINSLREKYSLDFSKRFQSDLCDLESKELVISFDVIYHLIEDSAYEEYMKLLFALSRRYVLIYSSNSDQNDSGYVFVPNIKHRYFQKEVPIEFKILEQHENLFPYSLLNPEGTSWSNFYLYAKND